MRPAFSWRRWRSCLIVLGPEPVSEAARRWEEAARDTTGNPYVIGEEFAPVLHEMRKALRIPE